MAAAVADIAVSTISGLAIAYIDYKDHSKGAKVTIYVKYSSFKIKYLKRVSFWKYKWKTKTVTYSYISRIPRLTWIK